MLPTRAFPDAEITIMGITNSEDFDSKRAIMNLRLIWLVIIKSGCSHSQMMRTKSWSACPALRHTILYSKQSKGSLCSVLSCIGKPFPTLTVLKNYCYPAKCIGRNCPLWILHLKSSNTSFPIGQSEPGLVDNLPAMLIALDDDWIMFPFAVLGSWYVELVAGKLRHSWNMCAFAYTFCCHCLYLL